MASLRASLGLSAGDSSRVERASRVSESPGFGWVEKRGNSEAEPLVLPIAEMICFRVLLVVMCLLFSPVVIKGSDFTTGHMLLFFCRGVGGEANKQMEVVDVDCVCPGLPSRHLDHLSQHP